RAILESARRGGQQDSGAANPAAAAGSSPEPDRALEEAVDQALARQFRPEFLNRIDEVIRFRPLGPADLQRIVRLQLDELAALLREQQLELQVEEAVIASLAEQGYEPEYGARPLRRVLRRRIENPLATELLEDHFRGARGVLVEAAGEAGPAGPLHFRPLDGPGNGIR
ncbi:MAG: ATP-dependent chaperone ClpB, partial [Cyanobium sp.]